MRYWIFILIPFLIAAAPSKPNTFTSGTTARSSEVNSNFDELYNYLTVGVDTLRTDAVDAIGEIKSSIRSGSDQTLVTGSAGTANDIAVWNSDGDIVGTSSALVWTGISTTLGVNGTVEAETIKVHITNTGTSAGSDICIDSNNQLCICNSCS